MKKFFPFIFVALLPLVASAYDAKIGGIYYNFLGNEAEVTYENFDVYKGGISDYSGIVVIPESVVHNGNTYRVTSIGECAFYNCNSMTSITIPESVTSIGKSAFSYCEGLASITIPNSVTSIEYHTFWCSGLTSITIPNSVTSIGLSAFYGCEGLTSITIPNSVTTIDYAALGWCKGLATVIISNSVTKIIDNPFPGCSNLTSIKVETGSVTYDSRNDCNAIIETATNTLIAGCKNTIIPNSVTNIGKGAFNRCSALSSITIPSSVTSIGNSAFEGCTSLTSITIPNSVTSIGQEAFWGCWALTSVTIGDKVTSIGDNAFSYCEVLTNVYCLAENVPKTSSYAFNDSPIGSATLHVPGKSLSLYKTSSPWKEFGTIVALTNGIESIEFSSQNVGGTTLDTYDLNGCKLTAPQKGTNIIRYSDGTTKKVLMK